MINIGINRGIKVYFLFLIFYSIFYLYLKHNVGNDTSISEWLINYKGGFTRRGLGGELNIFTANIFNLPLRISIFYYQALFHLTYLFLLFTYIRNLKFNIFQVFAFFSPLFLIYPIAEIEALGRKEILLLIFFILSMIFRVKTFLLNSLILVFFLFSLFYA